MMERVGELMKSSGQWFTMEPATRTSIWSFLVPPLTISNRPPSTPFEVRVATKTPEAERGSFVWLGHA